MKLSLKPLLLSAALSVVGLSSTVSYASSNASVSGIERAQPTVAQQTIIDNLVGDSSAIGLFSEQSFKKFETMLNKPLLRVTLNELHGLNPINSDNRKGSEIFAVATKFNDMLQQFVTYFSESTSSTYSTYKNSIKEVTSSVFSDKKCESTTAQMKS